MKRMTLLTMAIIMALAAATHSAVPKLINYQGYLKESGVAVTGTKSITFILYDASSGGTQLCSSGAQSVTVTNGLFSYKIGSGGCDLSAIDWNVSAVYLELTVEGTTLSPREQITGSAYSVETQAVNVEFTPAGNIAATDVQAAIAELDSEKLSLTGGTVAGAINATAFTGDGSGLTGVVSGGAVAKTGDEMSGALGISHGGSTSSLYVYQTGTTDQAGYFEITNASNSSLAALYAVSNSSANAIRGDNGAANGIAGRFGISNASNPNSAIYSVTAGTGNLFAGNHTGASGNLIQLQSSGVDMFIVDKNGVATATKFTGYSSGIDYAGYFESTNTSNPKSAIHAVTNSSISGAAAVSGLNSGISSAGLFIQSNPTTDAAALYGQSYGGTNSSAVQGRQYGTGHAGFFSIQNNSNNGHGVHAYTDGLGVLGYFQSNNVNNTSDVVYSWKQTGAGGALYSGNHAGTAGNLINLQSSGSDMFVVDKSGNVFASGTFTGDGTGLTGVVASGGVAKTGDEMSGALGISQGGATSSLYIYQTGTTNEAGYFEVNNAFNPSYTLTSTTNGTGHAGYFAITNVSNAAAALKGETSGTGPAVTGLNMGTGRAGNFRIDNVANTENALQISIVNGTGSLIDGDHAGASGNLMRLKSGGNDMLTVDKSGNVFASGTVSAISFSGDGSGLTGVVASGAVAKTGDTMSGALGISQSAATSSISVYQTGSTGMAGSFESTDSGNPDATLYVSSETATATVFVVNTKAGMPAWGVRGMTTSMGVGVRGDNDSTGYGVVGYNTSSGTGTFGKNTGTGYGLVGQNTGTGIAGYIHIVNSGNSSPALFLATDGTGALMMGNHTGVSGGLIQLQSGGSDMFVVDNSGNVFASGTYTGDGSGLTGVIAAGSVAKTGDTMSGTLGISASTNNPLFDANNSGTGIVGRFVTNNTGSATPTVWVESNSNTSFGAAFYAVQSGTGHDSLISRISNAGSSKNAVVGETFGSGTAIYGLNQGTGVAGLFESNNAANSSPVVYSVTTGTGPLYWGNHTGASGNLIQLQSGGADKFVVDKNGNVTAVGTVSGSCAAGMVDAGDYCIDLNERTAALYVNSTLDCRDDAPSKHLCSPDEWVAACKADLFTYTANTLNETSRVVSSTEWTFIRSNNTTCSAGTISYTNNLLDSNSAGYRCCYYK